MLTFRSFPNLLVTFSDNAVTHFLNAFTITDITLFTMVFFLYCFSMKQA